MSFLLMAESKNYLRIWAKQVMPAQTFNSIRRRVRRRGKKTGKDSATISSRESIARDLRALGIRESVDVFLHSSLSDLGWVDGGPAGVVQAVLDVAGPEATIIAPAYPMAGTMIEWMSIREPFDVRRSPSRMGAVTEHLRSMNGAMRSAHPTHSVVALGPRAFEYTHEHHEGPTPTGARSPFYKHIRFGGQILCLGSGVGKVTSYHVVEDVVPGFPVDPYLKEPMKKLVVFADGSQKLVETRVADPRLSVWRVDNFGPKEAEIYSLMRQCQIVRSGRVAAGQAHLIDAARLFELMPEWAARGVIIYHTPILSRMWRRLRMDRSYSLSARP
jgi:aminoglycoside 3-N-acetyltransferase